MYHYNSLAMVHRTELTLRTVIQKTIGRAVPETVWQYFRTIGRVSGVLQGDYLEEDLIADIEPVLQYENYVASVRRGSRVESQGETSREVVRREVSAYPELDALCDIMVIEASRNPEVIGFRNDILGGSLIPPAAVAEWMQDEARKAEGLPLSSQTDGGQTAMLDQVVHWRCGARVAARPFPDWPERSESALGNALAFPIPGRTTASPLGFHERSVPVPAQGPLWLLRFVAVGLMEEYPWSEAQAVGFILSGVSPRLPTASVARYRLFPFRIVLDLDPGLSASIVSSEYRKAQRELIRVQKRAKSQSEKQLRLAVFVAQGKSGTWTDMMESWNTQCRPEWACSNSRRFERDSTKALTALKQRRDRDRMPSPFKQIENTYGLR